MSRTLPLHVRSVSVETGVEQGSVGWHGRFQEEAGILPGDSLAGNRTQQDREQSSRGLIYCGRVNAMSAPRRRRDMTIDENPLSIGVASGVCPVLVVSARHESARRLALRCKTHECGLLAAGARVRRRSPT